MSSAPSYTKLRLMLPSLKLVSAARCTCNEQKTVQILENYYNVRYSFDPFDIDEVVQRVNLHSDIYLVQNSNHYRNVHNLMQHVARTAAHRRI